MKRGVLVFFSLFLLLIIGMQSVNGQAVFCGDPYNPENYSFLNTSRQRVIYENCLNDIQVDVYNANHSLFSARPKSISFGDSVSRQLRNNVATAQKACEALGFDTVDSFNCIYEHSTGNRCTYDNDGDYYTYGWDGSLFLEGPHSSVSGGFPSEEYSWLIDLVCSRPRYVCQPKTCEELYNESYQCGILDNGCGTNISCGVEYCTLNAGEEVNTSAPYCDHSTNASRIYYDGVQIMDVNQTCGIEVDNVCDMETFDHKILTSCTNGQVCVDPDGPTGNATGNEDPTCITPPSPSAHWADANGDEIPSGTHVGLSSFVRLISNENPPYDIRIDGVVGNNLTIFSPNWTVGNGLGDDGDSLDFWTVGGANSGEIIVDESIPNVPMKVSIANPHCGSDYMFPISLDIELELDDPDSLITGTLRVDGVSYNVSNSNGKDVVVRHDFTTAGDKRIDLTVRNTEGEVDRKTAQIMVIDPSTTGFYIASCIDAPKDAARFNSSEVLFDGRNTGSIYYDSTTSIAHRVPHEYMYYMWTFYHAGIPYSSKCEGFGNEDCDGDTGTGKSVRKFVRLFDVVNENSVSLSVYVKQDAVDDPTLITSP